MKSSIKVNKLRGKFQLHTISNEKNEDILEKWQILGMGGGNIPNEPGVSCSARK